MAGQGPLLRSLLGLVSGFDEGTWEALANKGLVRRARKDLDSGISVEVEESDSLLRVRIPPNIVEMPAGGPAKASCDCAARGICQHILIAGMWLEREAKAAPAEPAMEQVPVATQEMIEGEMLAISLEQLQKWAGAGNVREARGLAASGRRMEGADGVLTINFPGEGIQVRYIPGGGLDRAIVSGGTRDQRRIAAVAAVLFIHRANNRLEEEPASVSQALEEASEAPRTRLDVLIAARSILMEALQIGLSHVSVSLKARLQTLAMSAQGTNLPRLARMLRGVAQEVEAIIMRQGRASEAALFLAMARTHALVQALMQPDAKDRSDLIGVHRTQYHELQRLDLIGIAAYPWQTPSGYLGLTVLYWDPRNHSCFSWSDARPVVQTAGFDPLRRFRASGPWSGCASPEESANSRIALLKPRRNAEGRLSSSAGTSAMILGSVDVSEIDFGPRLFTNWGTLCAYANQAFPLGLRVTHPLDLIVVLQPYRFGLRVFDEQRQLFRWDILDAEGAKYSLAVPYAPLTKQAIKYLEDMDVSGDPTVRFVVKITGSEIGPVAEPLTLHRLDSSGGTMVHLAFADAGKAHASGQSDAAASGNFSNGDDDIDEAVESETQGPAYLEAVLGAIEKELERAAESGVSRLTPGVFDVSRRNVERMGLTPLAKALEGLKDDSPDRAGSALTLRYLCSLYRQSLFFN